MREEPMAETKRGVRVGWEALRTLLRGGSERRRPEGSRPSFDEEALRAGDRRTSPTKAGGNGQLPRLFHPPSHGSDLSVGK